MRSWGIILQLVIFRCCSWTLQIPDINICNKAWSSKHCIPWIWTFAFELCGCHPGCNIHASGKSSVPQSILFLSTREIGKEQERYIVPLQFIHDLIFLARLVGAFVHSYYVSAFLVISGYEDFEYECFQAFRYKVMLPAHLVLAICLIFQVLFLYTSI